MLTWQLLVALMQGLLEWLPISSQGQIVLFVYNIGAVPVSSLIALAVWLHFGTMFSVLARYPRDILRIISLRDRNLVRLLLIATIGTAIVGVPVYLVRKVALAAVLGSQLNVVVGLLLFATAVILYSSRQKAQQPEVTNNNTMQMPTNKVALVTGLAQGLSILPGLSRSGITVSSLLMQKVDKETALKFSFLMSVPAVLGIFFLELVSGDLTIATVSLTDLLIMDVIAFSVGLASMEALLRLSRKVSFWKLCAFIAVVAIVFGLPAFF
jgi:undecaprenyl-diphosphatase